METNSWTDVSSKEPIGKRMWHQSVHIDNELIVVGGAQTDINTIHSVVSINCHF